MCIHFYIFYLIGKTATHQNLIEISFFVTSSAQSVVAAADSTAATIDCISSHQALACSQDRYFVSSTWRLLQQGLSS